MEKNIPDEIISVSNSLEATSPEEVRKRLTNLLNELINKDFGGLVQLLYRLDVSEKKIRTYLENNPNTDAAPGLANLIIERQLQKIESRKNYRSKNSDSSNEERW